MPLQSEEQRGGHVVLHVRSNLIAADPVRLSGALTFMAGEVMPQVEGRPGSLGTSLYANPVLGLAILESFWASEHAMQASEQWVSPARREVVQRAEGTVSVERYGVFTYEQEAELIGGAGLRLTRMDLDPAAVEDAAEAYGDTAVPWLAEGEGFYAALLLIDRNTGHSVSETVWRDREALAASRSTAAAVRLETVGSMGCVVRAVEEYTLVSSSARKA
jgi:hypothetical protein